MCCQSGASGRGRSTQQRVAVNADRREVKSACRAAFRRLPGHLRLREQSIDLRVERRFEVSADPRGDGCRRKPVTSAVWREQPNGLSRRADQREEQIAVARSDLQQRRARGQQRPLDVAIRHIARLGLEIERTRQPFDASVGVGVRRGAPRGVRALSRETAHGRELLHRAGERGYRPAEFWCFAHDKSAGVASSITVPCCKRHRRHRALDHKSERTASSARSSDA